MSSLGIAKKAGIAMASALRTGVWSICLMLAQSKAKHATCFKYQATNRPAVGKHDFNRALTCTVGMEWGRRDGFRFHVEHARMSLC